MKMMCGFSTSALSDNSLSLFEFREVAFVYKHLRLLLNCVFNEVKGALCVLDEVEGVFCVLDAVEVALGVFNEVEKILLMFDEVEKLLLLFDEVEEKCVVRIDC